MSAVPTYLHPRDIAKEHSLFEIDEALDLLVQTATEQYDETGQIAAELQAEMAAYADAMGEKIDRIAAYLKAQKATAEIAAQEIARLEARKRAAENREKRLKEMLAALMKLKDVTKLRGRLNTISLQKNSTPSLMVTDPGEIPAAYYRATVVMSWPEWQAILNCIPPGELRSRLANSRNSNVEKELYRSILIDALRRGENVAGAGLSIGYHIRSL
jgi:hypothetical protein